MSSSKKFIKSVISMSMMTLISRVLGLLREICRASFLGTSLLGDAYVLAFSLPNLFRRLTAEGAMMNAFVPVYKEINEHGDEKKAFIYAFNFFLLTAICLTLFCFLFFFCAPLLIKYFFAAGLPKSSIEMTTFLSRIMFPYILLISLAAICQGVLNSHSVYWPSAFSPILLNVSIIGMAYFFSPMAENPAIPFALGVMIGGTLQLIFQIPFVIKCSKVSFSFDFKNPEIKQTFFNMGPGIFGAGIYQINIVIGNIIATYLEEGSLSVLSFSNRLMELVLGVFIVSIATVSLSDFSSLFLHKEWDKISDKTEYVIRLICFITLPVIAGLICIREDIIKVLFMRGEFDQQSLIMTSEALLFHAPGILFIGLNRVLLSIFYASKNYKTPVQVAFLTMLLNIILSLVLSFQFGFLGIAIANSVSQMFQTILLSFFFVKKKEIEIHYQRLFKCFAYNLCTALIMYFGLTIFNSMDFKFNAFLSLVIQIGIAVSIFVSLSAFNKKNELWFLMDLLSRKKR